MVDALRNAQHALSAPACTAFSSFCLADVAGMFVHHHHHHHVTH
jgi:hypothetical protein